MRKKLWFGATLFSILLLSTTLNVYAVIHEHYYYSDYAGMGHFRYSWHPELSDTCNPIQMSANLAGIGGGSSTDIKAEYWGIILCSDESPEDTSTIIPTLSSMTQADFEDLIRRTFAQDGVKIQDLEDDVSKAVLDALNQGKLKIDVRGLS